MGTNDIALQDNSFFDKENVPIVIGNDCDELDELSEDENIKTLDICVGLSFETWEYIKKCFDTFALQQGFSYKTRRSETDDSGIVRRLTYECSKSGKYVAQVTVDPVKRHNTSSQRT